MKYRFTFGADWKSGHTDWIDLPDDRKIVIGENLAVEIEQDVKFDMAISDEPVAMCHSSYNLFGDRWLGCTLGKGHGGTRHEWSGGMYHPKSTGATVSWEESA